MTSPLHEPEGVSGDTDTFTRHVGRSMDHPVNDDSPAELRVGRHSLPVSVTTLAAATASVVDRARRRTPIDVHLVNAYSVICATDNPDVRTALTGGGLNVMDGVPLVWLAKALGAAGERVYGPDLMLSVLDAGRAVGLKHYLYGATDNTVGLLRERLVDRFPGLDIVGVEAPPFRQLTAAEVADSQQAIRDSGAHVVWVGVGTPKQDLICHAWAQECGAVMVAVGAAFDFHAGVKRQAPRMLQRLGLEWLFRLAVEPRRLAKRYLVGNVRFLLEVARGARVARPTVTQPLATRIAS